MSISGLVAELRGIAAHVAAYPSGLRSQVVAPSSRASDEVPVVLVHGCFHNRSAFSALERSLRAAGFGRVYAMNYTATLESIPSLARRLDSFVERVARACGSERVDIVAHSLGGLIARWYVQERGGARRVGRCVTVGTPHAGTHAAYLGVGLTARDMRPRSAVLRRLRTGLESCTTPVVSIYSDEDVLVTAASARLPARAGVTNHLVTGQGHSSMLLSPGVFSLVISALGRRGAPRAA
jgi:pimeloyl-ACP methyl ester carboxylesterase